jgi:CRISPR-associated protein (TIGR03985 family)
MPQFDASPDIALLQGLARGSLKQNLAKAIRLWVWLHILYGETSAANEPFTFTDWRDTFFTATHPKGEQPNRLHDLTCNCNKTTQDWLLLFDANLLELELKRRQILTDEDVDVLLHRHLFAVTRRSLQADLYTLVELGWLQREGKQYERVEQFPAYPRSEGMTPVSVSYTLPILNPDLDIIAQNLAQPIAEVQRFFIEINYIIAKDKQDAVEDLQDRFKQLWYQTPIPPVRFLYHSSRKTESAICIVYPVCIYYAQRAIYLCGFGQAPDRGQWYNYRLDKITNLEELTWTDAEIPQFLLVAYQQQLLPSPDNIEEKMHAAWGFDFYLKSAKMLLRFDRLFHDRYIKHSFRHSTFQPISYREAEQFIRKQTGDERESLLQIFDRRSSKDAYYQATYRIGDTNVRQRLRAWRPHVEVFLPWILRQEMAREVATECQYYLDIFPR